MHMYLQLPLIAHWLHLEIVSGKVMLALYCHWLPVSILYFVFMMFFSCQCFWISSNDGSVLHLTELNAHSPFWFLCWSCYLWYPALFHVLLCSFHCLQTLKKWLVFLLSMQTLQYAWHCLGWWRVLQYLHACCTRLLDCAHWHFGLSLCIVLETFILSNSFMFCYTVHCICLNPLCLYSFFPC